MNTSASRLRPRLAMTSLWALLWAFLWLVLPAVMLAGCEDQPQPIQPNPNATKPVARPLVSHGNTAHQGEMGKHDHAAMMNSHAHHAEMNHGPKAVPEGMPAPAMLLSVYPDAMSGVNLHVSVKNFRFLAPQFETTTDMSVVEGHAHVYINGKKHSRLYAHDVHLPKPLFKPGKNEIEVSLNSHHHEVWTVGGKAIMARIEVILPDNNDSKAAQ